MIYKSIIFIIIGNVLQTTIISLQVVNVVDGMYRHQSSEDVYEEWDQAILQTLKNCPLKVNFYILFIPFRVKILFLLLQSYIKLSNGHLFHHFQVLVIQMVCGYLTYILGKFACKVKIQEFSFSAPLCAIVPVAATLILSACGARYTLKDYQCNYRHN